MVSPVLVGETAASSSRIRESVAEGRVSDAAAIMGRDFSVVGRVVHGESRGKGLGFPTANLEMLGLHPANGVYAVQVALSEDPETLIPGVANLGVQPTFNGRRFCAEVHLLDYEGDLYGKELTVYFVDRIRSERKFDSAKELVERIEIDVLEARKLIRCRLDG
jgi:riboflavin kinase/FMN adenylyltransferase